MKSRFFYIKISIILFFIFFSQSFKSLAQEYFYYHNNIRIPLELSHNKIIVKFVNGTEKSTKKRIISSFKDLKPLEDQMILPAPDISIVEVQTDVSEKALYIVQKSLESNQNIEYANSFFLYPFDSTLQAITNQFIVKLKSTNFYSDLESICLKTNTAISAKDEYSEGIYIISADKFSSGNALQMANLFYETGLFEFAEPDFLKLLKPLATVNDNYFNYQWALKNNGTSIQYNGTSDADMDVDNAWDISTGSSSIRVAIIDEGVNLTHPDLSANLVTGYDASGQGSGGGPSGNDAHGTNCAGIVAAVGNNNLGIAGIAYNSKIVPIRIAYSSSGNWVTTNSWISNSINWSWRNGSADVLSNSWGGGSPSAIINTAITNAQTNGRNGLGCVVLFAAGNSNNAVIYPGSLSNVIAVAAMSMCNQRKVPSSCDGETWWGSCYGADVDVAAPGVKIASTDIAGSAGYSSGDYYLTFNGTSSACPNAAGVVALILSVNPALTYLEARQILETTCQKVGSYSYTTTAAHSNGSWCSDMGYGSINAFEAVKEAMVYTSIPYFDGFENGIGQFWKFENSNNYGRIQISGNYNPHTNSNHLLMDVNTNNHIDTNKAKLYVNLNGKHNVKLDFWWKNINDEYNTKDGVYFSNNKGQTFTKLFNLSQRSNNYQHILIDISHLTDSLGIGLTNKSVIMFQHQDDSSLTNDGFAFDDISISGYSADLTIKNTTASPVNVARDSSTTVGCDLINTGSWAADSSMIAFYLSSDSIFSTDDVLLSTSNVGIIQAKDTLSITKSIHIPLNTNPGSSYILFLADANNDIIDSIETNNCNHKQINIISYPPVITIHPNSQATIVGDNLHLSVTSAGAATLTYQWQKNGTNINGATSSVFNKYNLSYSDSGYYRCIVSNSYGADTSNNAHIQVKNYLNLCASNSTEGSNGIVYDPGGAAGYYADNLSCGLLINPACADSIRLSFSSFDLEMNYDYLEVYDGTDTNGTPILVATGNTIPSGVVATSGAMYLYFTSDASVTRPGFTATWTTVKTVLHANFSINDSSQCLRTNNFTLTNTSSINSGSYSNFWKFGDSTTSSSPSPTKSYNTSGIYAIKLITTESNDCKDSISKNVYVRTHPETAFTINDTSQCLRGNSFEYTNISGISSGNYSNLWKYGDNTTSTTVSPAKSYSSEGYYIVSLITTSNYNCKDSISKNVYVRPQPVTAFAINDTSQCQRGNSFVFTNISTISSGNYSNLWKYGDSTTSTTTSASKSYSNTGTYIASLVTTSDYNCIDSISQNIYVRPHPVSAFIVNDSSQCQRGNSFVFTNISTISSGNYSNLWKYGDSTTSTTTSVSKSYSNTGTYIASLVTTSDYNCIDSISQNIYVRPHPVSAFIVNDSSQCQRGNSFVFTNASAISSGNYSTLWKYGDSTTSTTTSASKSYSNTGTYIASLVTTSDFNCKDSISKNIYVRPHPVTAFTINDTSQCQRGNSFIYTNSSSISSGSFSDQWNFGDTTSSTASSATKTYTNPGSFVVGLVTTSDYGCNDSVSKNVFVRPHPVTLFAVNDSSQCLRGNSFILTNNTSINFGTYSNTWSFGDNSTSYVSAPAKTYSNTGSYNVKLVCISGYGCSDSIDKTFLVMVHPVASFSVNDSIQCEHGNSFDFSNNSIISKGIFTNLWLFGDNNSSNLITPIHHYSGLNYDTLTVRLITESDQGCKDSTEKNMILMPSPHAAFQVNNDKQCLGVNSFLFVNNTTYPLGSGTALWDFGNGDTSTLYSSVYHYQLADTFKIKLLVMSDYGCPDSANQTIIVYPQPQAGFIINDTAQCLKNNLFQMTDDSKISNDTIASYSWNLGDGNTYGFKNISHSFISENTYTVVHFVTSSMGCKDSVSKIVYAFPMPVSAFSAKDSSQCLNGNLFKFINNSTLSDGNLSYLWLFDDGNSLTDTNATHSYLNFDNYTVKLIASSQNNCTDSSSKTISVRKSPVVNLGNDTTLYDNQSITLNAGSGFDSCIWSNNQTSHSILIDTNGIGLNKKLIWVKLLLDGCAGYDSINIAFIKYISINDPLSNLDIRIFPNPVTNIVNIIVGQLSKELNLTLSDMNGKILKVMKLKPYDNINTYQMDVSGLGKGMYNLTFSNIDFKKHVKIVKN